MSVTSTLDTVDVKATVNGSTITINTPAININASDDAAISLIDVSSNPHPDQASPLFTDTKSKSVAKRALNIVSLLEKPKYLKVLDVEWCSSSDRKHWDQYDVTYDAKNNCYELSQYSFIFDTSKDYKDLFTFGEQRKSLTFEQLSNHILEQDSKIQWAYIETRSKEQDTDHKQTWFIGSHD